MPHTGFGTGAGEIQVGPGGAIEFRRQETLLKTGALQDAIFNSANFSSIATDEKGVIQIFNVGAERMLGYAAADVLNRITPADISDPQEVIARAEALSLELATPITPGFEALVFKASRGIEDIYELTYIRRDGSRFPAIVSVTALRDAQESIIGYLLIGTDNTARKEAEEALLQAGALQSAIFNSANFSSIATDAKGVIQIFNVGAERMLGYTAAEVMNKITPADISDPQELIARAKALSVELGTPITPGFEALVFKASRGIEDIYELTYIRKDGSRFPAVVSVTALRDAQDAIIGYLLIGTELKAGALQSAIFNSAYFSSIATDEKGVIQIFNVGAERMLGYTASEVMNKITPADISDPQEVIARAEALSLELATPITPGFEALVFKASRGIEDIYELTYIRKDGSRFPAIVSVTALRNAQENIIGYLLIGTDNTARKQIEAAQALLDQRLRDQQFYTRSLIESNIDALMTTDPQGIISDVNQQMMSLTGRTRDELIGAPCKNFFTDPGRADAAIKRVLTENKVNNYELTVRALNGDETVVSYNAATFYDRDRKLQGVFAAARDVTERKRFDRTLQEKNIELEHATRMKSEFLEQQVQARTEEITNLNAELEERVRHRTAQLYAANQELAAFSYSLSHDLRTPLSAIDGFSDLLGAEIANPTDRGKHFLARIRAGVAYMSQLIDAMLVLAHVSQTSPHWARVDLSAVALAVLGGLQEREPGRVAHWDIQPDLVAQGDPQLLQQVLENLLGNAWKFCSGQPQTRISFERKCGADGQAVYVVRDNGAGFDMAYSGKLFGTFQRLHSASEFPGTGIGLATVHRIITRHDGKIWADSVEGQGANFYFTLGDAAAQGPAGATSAPG